ncbi:MAG: transcriptional repressor LexA [Patescibacteria group bacterium]|nr:transcriptional repressor LexA [Patescibacteria group bacterium]MDE2438615.1 transcriptional repressor LexA [Patescibacteria group bacterium]
MSHVSHKPTKLQQKVLDVIMRYHEKHNAAPTIYEIQKKLALISSRSVTQHLEALEKKGFIHRTRYKNRGIMLTSTLKDGEMVLLPVFASAGCGSPAVIAERAFDEFMEVASNLLKGKKKEDLFVMKAIGNSMNEAGIRDGDYVLVERIVDQDFEMGDSVVAIIDDHAVIKRYTRADDLIILQPVSSDRAHRAIILGGDATYKIFGKVIRTIHMPKTRDIQYAPVVS